MGESRVNLEIHPKKTALFFFRITVILVMIHIVFSTFDYILKGKVVGFFMKFVDLDLEKSVPTLYSVFLMLLCAITLWIISKQEIRKKTGLGIYWRGISLIFFFLAIDEGTRFHESVGDLVESLMHSNTLPVQPEGFLYWPWIIPYSVFCLAVGLIFIPFLIKLPKRSRNLFILAGAIYLAGAVMIEVISAREANLFGLNSIIYWFLYTIEEFLEMSGIVLFLYALLDYMVKETGQVLLTLKRSP